MITDAIVLIAVSQLVCLGAIGYLAMQVHNLHREASDRLPNGLPGRESKQPRSGRGPVPPMELVRRSAVSAYTGHTGRGGSQTARSNATQPPQQAPLPAHDVREIVAKMATLGVDVPTLARRVGRSEEEIRLILRRPPGSAQAAQLPAYSSRAKGGAI